LKGEGGSARFRAGGPEVRPRARIALSIALLAMLTPGAAWVAFQILFMRDLPDLRSLDGYRPNLVTKVYSVDGKPIGEFYRENREVVPIERVPAHVVHAFVAAEDDAFYEHQGVDYMSILRAAVANLRAGEIRQGGSTITQQVAKTFLLSSERTYIRKVKDMILAKRIEDHLDKTEILFLYLNQIYLGSGAYGVQAAATTYFAKPVEQLTLAEAALIAGLVPAPSRYTPFRDEDAARRRQHHVLRRMLEEGYITEMEHLSALEAPLTLAKPQKDPLREASAGFVEEVRRYLVARLGAEEVLTGGLEVRTTMNAELQKAANDAVRWGLEEHDRRRGYRGPLRTIPKESWAETLWEIEKSNGAPPWPAGARLQALVVEVDDEREEARLLLSKEQDAKLTLKDVAWARPVDPKRDGEGAELRHIKRALSPGQIVELLKLGEESGGNGAAPRFSLYQEPRAEGALLSLELPLGHVRAMIGGYSFERSQFNRAVQSRRQPGSAFKPIIYATALKRGFTPSRIVYDTPIVFEDFETGSLWKPENYEERFYGPITLREALARSRNIATIKILREIGVRPVLRTAEGLGIRSPLDPDLSLALGSSEVTLAELVSAYSAFPNGGKPVNPIFILEVRDRNGELLDRDVSIFADELAVPEEETAPPTPEIPRSDLELALAKIRDSVDADENGTNEEPGIDAVTAYLMTDLLRAVVQEGTGWRAKQLGRPVAGKTGTTNELHDAWFVGFTPQVVTGVWVGYDSPRPLGRNETGALAASPIFVDYMQGALARLPPVDFDPPEGVVFARIDAKTGLLAAPGAEEALFQPFREGTAPTETSPVGLTADPQVPPRLD
jgi:penicillin-binding protein 1A